MVRRVSRKESATNDEEREESMPEGTAEQNEAVDVRVSVYENVVVIVFSLKQGVLV